MITGRITKGIGGLYFVSCNGIMYECSARGILRKNKTIPTVGDFVNITVIDENNKKGTIEEINQRENILIRPKVSNINCAVIVFAAANPDINIELLDKFLILAEKQNIKEIIICINKIDITDINKFKEFYNIYNKIYKVLFTSTKKGTGIIELKESIISKVSVFAGPSGVGKSSIINSIIPKSNLKTGEISNKIKRGKHTTRQVELISVDDKNTFIVDSPGFTSLDLNFIEADELQFCFREFKPYLSKCKFNDCIHINEPDCEVKFQIDKNISEQRYNRYNNFYNEIKNRR